MRTCGFAEDDSRRQGFDAGYAEARRLVLEQNDLDGALNCLHTVKPASQSDVQRWTDLVAALLFHKGDGQASMAVLTGHGSSSCSDSSTASSIQMLKRWLDQRRSESDDS